MTETKAPLGQAPPVSPAASPPWLRRLDGSAGVIDTAEAQRHYARTAGWAIRRIMRAADLAARYAGADRDGAATELLLARVPARIANQGETDAPGIAASAAGTDAGQLGRAAVSEPSAGDATPATSAAASAPAMRLQRHAAGSGVIKPDVPHAADYQAAALSLRAGLHERLAARAHSAAPASMHVARRSERGNDAAPVAARMAPANPAPTGAASGALAHATSKPGSAARASLAAQSHAAVDATLALARSDIGSRPEAGVTRRTDASALQRKIGDAQIDASARAPAAARPAMRASDSAAAQSHDAETLVTRRADAPTLRRKVGDSDTSDASTRAIAQTAAAASSHDGAATTLPLAHLRAGRTSETGGARRTDAPPVQRKISDSGAEAPVRATATAGPAVRATEAAAAEARRGTSTTLPLAHAGGSSEGRRAQRGAAASTLHRKIGEPDTLAAAEAGRAAPTAAPVAALSPDAAGSMLPLARRPSATGVTQRDAAVPTLHRKIGDPSIDGAVDSMQSSTTLARARAAAPFASAQPHSETTLQLVRVGASAAQAPDVFSRPGAGAPVVPTQPEDGVPSAAAIARGAPATIAPDSIVHQMANRPLTLARSPDSGDAAGTPASAVHDAAAANAMHTSGGDQAIARTAETPRVPAPAAPILVWRAVDNANPRPRSARLSSDASGGVLMRAGAGDVPDPGSAASGMSAAAAPPAAAAAPGAASSPALDMNRLAEQIMRAIARRLEIERERRGGMGWH